MASGVHGVGGAQEHLFIVTELLRDNLYEFSKFNRESGAENYFTLPRLQKITRVPQAYPLPPHPHRAMPPPRHTRTAARCLQKLPAGMDCCATEAVQRREEGGSGEGGGGGDCYQRMQER